MTKGQSFAIVEILVNLRAAHCVNLSNNGQFLDSECSLRRIYRLVLRSCFLN